MCESEVHHVGISRYLYLLTATLSSTSSITRICAAEMAVRYAALSACLKYIRDASG